MKVELKDKINCYLRPASGNAQFMRPVIVNRFPTPGSRNVDTDTRSQV